LNATFHNITYFNLKTNLNFSFDFFLVCQQISRGVVAIFGPTNLATLDMLNSLTNFYNIPFISWSYLDRVKLESQQSIINTKSTKTVKKRNAYSRPRIMSDFNQNYYNNEDHFEDYDEFEYNNDENGSIIEQENDYPAENVKSSLTHNRLPFQIYMRPDLAPALISLIDFYDWHTIYYIYNYQQAITNMEKLFEQQNNDPKFLFRMLVRRASETLNFRDMLRAIEAANDHYYNPNTQLNEKIIMVIDLDSKESYTHFLNQIKDLGMTKAKYSYVLATLVRILSVLFYEN
jgi:hypothetical protein